MIKEAQVAMFMEQLKKKKLRLSSALVRFDNVPRGISSSLLERIAVTERECILVYEYFFRRNVRTDAFLRRFASDCRGVLGEELRRLVRAGVKPVLRLNYFSWQLQHFQLQMECETIRKLACQGRSMSLAFPSQLGMFELSLSIPHELIALLAVFSFSLEL